MFHKKEGHIVLCEVSPTDVVSIPVDYNNTKMRVCYYKVIAEYKNFENLDSSLITEVALNGKADFNKTLVADEQDKYLVLGLGIENEEDAGDEEEGLPITTLGENLNWDRARQLAGSQVDLYSEVRIINQRTRLVEKTYFTN